MAIVKHDIPLMEYDDNRMSVIMPDHEKLDLKLPEKAVFAFLGSCIDRYAQQHGARVMTHFISITKKYPVYVTEYNGEEICLCQAPMGAAAATQIMDWLISYGVKKIISTGSCGVLVDLPENTFLVPEKALRDEGTSYHYLPPSRFVELDTEVLHSIGQTLREKGIPFINCVTWSTDGFFRETRDKIEYRKTEGCSVVEMECAALAACAKLRGVKFGQILFTADSLANLDEYNERDWGKESLERALMLSLDLISDM